MTHRIQCRTGFDITATGVRSHYRENRIPFRDDAGHDITDLESWTRARNQQRNWETINQIISLRCLPERITMPQRHDGHWTFDFEVPSLSSISASDDDLELLLQDADGIPMITGLDEHIELDAVLKPGSNIWFELQNDK
jgi:hypothetical protein